MSEQPAKVYKNNWRVTCYGCNRTYVDHRRRFGRCLHCKSPAIVFHREEGKGNAFSRLTDGTFSK